MLFSNLALGVQACYRGQQLYDTERTRAMVTKWVQWFKEYRDILESDLIHGRRADGRDLDWMLHVNPRLDVKGMLIVFNPLEHPVEKNIPVNLYYTGLTDNAQLSASGTEATTVPIPRDYIAEVPVSLPANGFQWYAIR